MGLEAVMLCIDNSEWTRNGDFKPSRFEGQQDAANLICDAKTQQNPESTLGMMTMAGKRPEIFLTQTNDIGRLLSTIQKMPISGYVDLARAIKIAQLSLKHRQNKNQKQRIVAFVGSPIEGLDDREMTKLGKQLRKNDVAIDVINFGHPENIPLLTALVDNCNKSGNSHLIDVQYGMNIADTIITSPVVAFDTGYDNPPEGGEANAQPSGEGGGRFAEYGGIDPNLDPELAMAIRISLEEAKNEGTKPAEAPKTEDKPAEGASKTGDVEMKPEGQPAGEDQEMGEEEEDYEALLEEAKRLSMENYQGDKGETAKEDEAKNDYDLEGVINEEFLGDLMKDLGVDMTEDAIKT